MSPLPDAEGKAQLSCAQPRHLPRLLRNQATRRDRLPARVPAFGGVPGAPAAVVRKQQEADVAALLPSMAGLTERQHQLFFLFQSVIARSKPDGLARLTDDDVAEAAAACASTIETAARGVLYDHMPTTLPAQKLAGEFRALLVEVRQQGATVYDREAAIALRAIE